jgi:hypothetical protein
MTRGATGPSIALAILLIPAAAPAQLLPPRPGATTMATCDANRIDPESYALTTRAEASIVTEDRLDWWDGFDVGSAFDALHELNSASTWAAERALALDPGNLLAHGLLARQYVITGYDGAQALTEWRTVLDAGGAIVWTATLYDVDAKSYFVMAFDREAIRIYHFGELAGRFETRLGVPQFPGRRPGASLARVGRVP